MESSNVNKNEISDNVYVNRNGVIKLTWSLIGEVDGVFEWDGQLDFYTIYNTGFNYNK